MVIVYPTKIKIMCKLFWLILIHHKDALFDFMVSMGNEYKFIVFCVGRSKGSTVL